MKRYKQTAIWLFSFSNPLTRIQLWQIPGASNTISTKSADVMINCEGRIHNGWSRLPAGLPFRALISSISPQGLRQIWKGHKNPLTSTFHHRCRLFTLYGICTVLFHSMDQHYRLPPLSVLQAIRMHEEYLQQCTQQWTVQYCACAFPFHPWIHYVCHLSVRITSKL